MYEINRFGNFTGFPAWGQPWNKHNHHPAIEHLSGAMDVINEEMRSSGYSNVYIKYFNAEYFSRGEPQSRQDSVVELLKYLLDKLMPIGILHVCQVRQAHEILGAIEKTNKDAKRIRLSKMFYETIPSMGTIGHQVINNDELIARKRNHLKFVEEALCFLDEGKYRQINALDYFCEAFLQCELETLDQNSHQYQKLEAWIENTQQWGNSTFQIRNLFKMNKRSTEGFVQQAIPNHRYLFHSTYANNVLSILKFGLMPNSGAPAAFNLGPGIYFSDTAAGVLGRFLGSINVGIIFVCRVALGQQHEVTEYFGSDVDSNAIYETNHSLFLNKNVGKEINMTTFDGDLQIVSERLNEANEYVVPHPNQVKIEYILVVSRDN